MPRIIGIDIPRDKKTEIALTYIYGLGRVLSRKLLHETQIDGAKRAKDLTDDEVLKIGRDPFLVAYALVALGKRCVVTTEVSKPKRLRANRHLPNICDEFKVPWCNTFAFVRALNFSTNWKSAKD